MDTKTFLEVFNVTNDKKMLCKKHIIAEKYISYQEKIAYCQNIINNTCYVKVDEHTEVFSQNSPARFIQFHLTLINLYTDVEIDFDHVLDEFNALDKCEAFDALITAIAEGCSHEYTTFNTVLKMMLDDEMLNKRDLTSWLDEKMLGLSFLFDALKDIDLSKLIKTEDE